MDKKQLDTLGMYQTTYGILQENNSAWNTNVPFTSTVNAFKIYIDMINAQHAIQKEDITGITADKKNLRLKLEEDCFTISNALVFYATVTDNLALYKMVYIPRSTFTLTRDADLVGLCHQIHKDADANAAALLPYGVTATMINDLKNLNDSFAKEIHKPRDAKTGVTLATEAIAKAFEDADDLLKNRIDKGMELFRTSHSKFYTIYQKARIIVNSPTRRRALKISFFDSETGKPLKGVKSNIDGKKIRPSSAKGNNFVQHLAEGSHKLVASLDDYAEESVDFTSVKGEMKKLVVKLRKK